MEDFFSKALIAVGMFALLIVLGAALSFPFMWLWNGSLVPAVTWAHDIEWPQAWGLMILGSLMFKSYSK